MVSWYAGCIIHHPGTDMIKLQRIRLDHKVTGALWEWKGYLWQSHFCRLLKPVILFKGQQLKLFARYEPVWAAPPREARMQRCSRGKAPAGWKGRKGKLLGREARMEKKSDQEGSSWKIDERLLSPCPPPSTFTVSPLSDQPGPRPPALLWPAVSLGRSAVGGETLQTAKHIKPKRREFYFHIWWNFILFLSMTTRKMLFDWFSHNKHLVLSQKKNSLKQMSLRHDTNENT